MGVFGNDYVLEGARDDIEDSIINCLGLLFEHISKWVFIPTKQSISWLNSIKNNRIRLINIKESSKANSTYFKQFSIVNNISKINKETVSNLNKNKNDLRKFDLQKIYSDFSSLDLILDIDYLRNYLFKYQYNSSIDIEDCLIYDK